jgi:hypothetical protein
MEMCGVCVGGGGEGTTLLHRFLHVLKYVGVSVFMKFYSL